MSKIDEVTGEIIEDADPALTPEEEQPETPETPEVGEEPEKPKEDIDFEKEAQELEQKPQRTELEKAVFTREQIDKRIQELGGESMRSSKKEEPQYITKDDLADDYSRSLAKSENEHKVVMWHYKNSIQRTGNIREDIDNAYWLAHKNKIRRTHVELARVEQPGRGGGAGQRVLQRQTHEMPKEHQLILRRRGFNQNPKTGEWEAKHTKYAYDPSKKEWVSVKR